MFNRKTGRPFVGARDDGSHAAWETSVVTQLHINAVQKYAGGVREQWLRKEQRVPIFAFADFRLATPVTSIPDLSNLWYGIENAMKKRLIYDDSQIVGLLLVKRLAERLDDVGATVMLTDVNLTTDLFNMMQRLRRLAA